MEIVSMIYSLFIVVFLIVITGRFMVWLIKKSTGKRFKWLAMFTLFCMIVFIVFFIHHFPAGTF
mgnify:CR=1 FL=1|jgi:cytochrome bd-type quinol oxidase subunit 2